MYYLYGNISTPSFICVVKGSSNNKVLLSLWLYSCLKIVLDRIISNNSLTILCSVA